MTIFILICTIIVIICFSVSRINLYKSYNSYYSKEVNKLEDNLKKEQTNNNQTLEKLNKVAYTNPITKLGNMDYFIARSSELFEEAPEASYSMIVFNISNMGKINQLFGPTEGDNAVLYAAHTLRDIGQREHFLFAHVYSNLFGMIVKEKSDKEIVDLVDLITSYVSKYSENFDVLIAFGIYHIKDIKKPVISMINACTLAQKFIKDPMECNYLFYSRELEEDFDNNKKMSQDMEEAIDGHKFLMYLQPMVDLHSFKIVSAEALVRWDYPGKGILSPYAFIPLFEGTNLVQKLDYYMWEECCKTIRRWIDNKLEPTPIAMNISPVHFQSVEFIKHLNELCDHYLINKKLLILELPERGISNSKNISDIITELKKNDYTICIDNFGSINSPLNLFRDYPFDRMKIDRSFLNKNSDSEDGMTILRYLIAMAKEVGLMVITEGVENLEQTNFLGEIGSDVAQGYFFSKPVPLREFDMLSHSMVKRVYQSNEYYPTFEDLEKDLNLISYMIKQN